MASEISSLDEWRSSRLFAVVPLLFHMRIESISDRALSAPAAKKKRVKRGVKEVVKALKKGEKGCVSMSFWCSFFFSSSSRSHQLDEPRGQTLCC
jgi:hypothetical protein